MSGLFVKPGLILPERELVERFIQSSGPGGQNVNKVASAVQLRFDIAASPSLPPDARARLLALADARLGKDGVLTVTARRFREQERNRADARDRLAALLRAALTPPKPRRSTRVPKASKRARLEGKKRLGARKRDRRRPDAD